MQLHNSIVIDIKGFWHAGTGRSAGALTDALVQKDAQGLPVVGGRHIKGLLRHALAKSEGLGWFKGHTLPDGPAKTIEALLFGSPNQQESRFATLPGMLIVSDASLPEEEAQWLAAAEQAVARQHLYSHVSSTAMTEKGTAKADSLRSLEVTLPMQLRANLWLDLTAVDSAHRTQQQAWLQQVEPWLPLVEASTMLDSLGASRSRGLGEAQVVWTSSISKGGRK